MCYSITCSTVILTLARYHFRLFQLASSVNCHGARCIHFAVSLGRRGALFFLRRQMNTFGSIFTKKIQTFVCDYITLLRLILNWEKYKPWIQLYYEASNQTKQHFSISFFLVSMSLNNLFLTKFLIFLTTHFANIVM